MRFSRKQLEIVLYDNMKRPRMTILEGAVRSGKTFINNVLWLKHIKRFKNRNLKFIMSGYTIDSLKRNVLDDLTSKLGIDIRLSRRNEFELFGNKIVCFGGCRNDSQNSLKGFTSYGWYANEVSEQNPGMVKQALARCSGAGARIFWDTNPESPTHFIKTGFIDKADENIKIWHFCLEDNPFLDPLYIESIKKLSGATDSAWYLRNILGLWVSGGNIIYDHYKIDNKNFHDKKILRDYDELIAGVDFGRGGLSPFSFLLLGRIESYYAVIDEVYRAGCLNTEFIRLVNQRLDAYYLKIKPSLIVYGDSADPDKLVEWSRAGFRIYPSLKGPDSVLWGIEVVKSVDLSIYSRCKYTIEEIQNYCWDTDINGDVVVGKPVKINDHCMDAMRYAIYTHIQRNGGIRNNWYDKNSDGIMALKRRR